MIESAEKTEDALVTIQPMFPSNWRYITVPFGKMLVTLVVGLLAANLKDA